MRVQPLLSICIPSRNRQRYFQQTIRNLLSSLRTDVEFVFADNSDDPAIMAEFMESVASDPRVVFIPSGDRVFSLRDNWERTVVAATGAWICVIGDDDHVDVNVAALIERLVAINPDIDALAWSRPVYTWPVEGGLPVSIPIEMETKVYDMPRSLMWERTFLWKDSVTGVPDCPYTVYHCAVSARLMDKIKTRFGGRYFENPYPDLETALKVLTLGRNLVFSERPFSVAGICAASNASSFGSVKRIREVNQAFMADLGRNLEQDDYLRDFPFPCYLGNPVCVAQAQLWFKSTYHIEISGWEANFARACALSCQYFQTEEGYVETVEGFRQGFATWKEGAFLKDFNPLPYRPPQQLLPYTGNVATQINHRMWVGDTIGGARTPGDFFDIVTQMIAPVDQLDITVQAPLAMAQSLQEKVA